VTHGTLYLATGLVLILIGLACALFKRNLLRMILGFSIMDTGVHLLIASIGYIPGRTAPIIDDPSMLADPAAASGADPSALAVIAERIVDPVPQALVLTAIVIGVGVTALMLAYAVRLYAREGTLDVSAFRRLKW
jgi:multicomponent Na+:H+ antiporter subunit C